MAFSGLPRSVSWDDFSERDKAPPNEKESAFTKAVWPFTWSYEEDTPGHYVTKDLSVSVSMDPSRSWVVASAETSALLKHEQGHYDITALGARDFHRRLADVTAKSGKGIREAVAKLQADTQTAIDAMNNRYDSKTSGTDHGADASAQQRWSDRIAAALADPDATLASVGP